MKKYIMSIVCALGSGCAQANMIKKIDDHRTDARKETGRYLEVGDVSLYFDKKQEVHPLPSSPKQSKQGEFVFFFPDALIGNNEVKEVIKKINEGKNELYAVEIKGVTTPKPGVMLIVRCDPARIGVTYDFFDSIKREKGVVFRFHDKQFLKKLQTQEKPTSLLACADRARVVVIDSGHGGSDAGAIGPHNASEKQICLAIGSAVAEQLKKKGVRGLLTRTHDCTMPLGERTTFANGAQADLFVSIHANSAANKNAHGIETYCPSHALYEEKFSTLSAHENGLVHAWQQEQSAKAQQFAHVLHNHVVASAKKNNTHFVDRGVRCAISQVLLGTRMPAVLIEVGFLTNDHEAELLIDPTYQQTIAQGICSGICAYLSTH